jgi:hypothetical protein
MTALSENRERLLQEITKEIPLDRIAEIHFFQPIKQGGMESGVAVVAMETASAEARHIVFTARYRLTLKGPDRGKWESSIVAEADAPLVTVDAVVRGVQRRSGDVEDPERCSGDELRAMLGEEKRHQQQQQP